MAVKGCDYVLHEAALGSVPRSIDDPMATNDVNICGFLNMLKAAHEKNIKRFVYASSSSVYGDNSEVPKIEEHTGKPLSPYALTKYVDELYADVFHKVYGLQFIGLRYFNVFGRRQDPNGPYAAVIPLFIRQFMGHEHPCINGDGTYSRDFTYIDNVLHMNMLAITTSNPNAYNQIFNTACGDSTTILHLAKATRALVARYVPKVSDVQIFFRPPRVGDVAHSLASIDKAKKLLGYRPCVMFDEGLDLTVKWYYDHWCNIEK